MKNRMQNVSFEWCGTFLETVSRRFIVWAVIALMGVAAQASDLFFSTPVTITGNASDILASGTNLYAYAWNGTSANSGTVTNNGVSFRLTNQYGSNFDGNLSVTWAAVYGGSDQVSAASSLPADYKKLVGGVLYSANSSETVTLRKLIAGHQYAAQVWASDSRGNSSGVTVSNLTGKAVYLDYNNINAAGGVGQFVVGRFMASSTNEPLIFAGGNNYLNALQLRDISGLGYWTGLSGNTLDSSSSAFSTNMLGTALALGNLAVAEAAGAGQVTFADTYFDGGAEIAVTQTNLTVASGGVSAQRFYFNNYAANYTIASADTNGIRGASTLYKSGAGWLTLAGANSYTGATVINAGTLRIGGGGTEGSLNRASVITLGNGATLAFDRTDQYGGVVSNVITGSGALIVNGGSLALGGLNTYTGPTTVNAGTCNVCTARMQADVTTWGLVTVNSNATFSTSVSRPFGYPQATQASVDKLISFFVNGGTLSYSLGLDFKNLRLAGGSVLNSGGMLMYGDISADAGTISSIAGSGGYVQLRKPATDTLFTVGSNATLTISQAVVSDASYITSATQGFTKQGGGTLVLAGNNTYAGKTTIQEGTLQIGAGGTAGTLGTNAVNNNASLVFNRSDGDTVSRAISGSGSVTIASGTFTLSGTNTYSGATLVSGGTLRLPHLQALSTNTAVSIASGAKVKLDFTGTMMVRSLTVNGVLQTRNRLYSKNNLPAAFDSAGNGYLFVTEGMAPKGTLIRVF